jgi:hypothetical protein
MSKAYVAALQTVLDHGVCFFFPRIFLRELVRVLTDRFFLQMQVLYVVSMNDQMIKSCRVIHRCTISPAYSSCALYRWGRASVSCLSKVTRDETN